MTKNGAFASPFTPRAEPRCSSFSGVPWPVDRASLTALVDLGLTDDQIASYFAIDANEVLSQRKSIGLEAS